MIDRDARRVRSIQSSFSKLFATKKRHASTPMTNMPYAANSLAPDVSPSVLSDGLAKRHNRDRFAFILSNFEASFDTEASVTDDALAHQLAGTEDCLSLCRGKIGEA
jgi:hypothetical protein